MMAPEKSFGDWYNQRMDDGGPIYMETQSGHLIVEPWNAVSSLLILIPAIYWIYRMRKDGRHSKLMWAIILLVITGGIGSALFHGFRASVFFLLLDIIPSAILAILLSVYFWIKVLRKWWYIFFIYLPLFGSRFLFWGVLPQHVSINISYFITGFSIGLPLVIYLYKTKFNDWQLVVPAILSFIIALFFRQIDHNPISFLPMGTHFLWHAFSAVGAYFILAYLHGAIASGLIGRSPNPPAFSQYPA